MSAAPRYRARVRHAAQLVCVCRNGELVKVGAAAMNDVCVIENGALVVDGDGKLIFVGTDAELDARAEFADAALFEHDVDASGKCVLPGNCVSILWAKFLMVLKDLADVDWSSECT